MTNSTRRAVLLDLGGVLVDVDHGRALLAFGQRTGRSPESIRRAFEGDNLHGDFNIGRIDEALFRARVLSRLDAALSDPEFDAAWCSTIAPISHIESLLKGLAAQNDLYLLSNTDPIHFSWVKTHCPWIDDFQGLHLSYEVGLAKPDPRYYKSALTRFDLQPKNCVFFDDLLSNVDAAQNVGIESFRVTGAGLTLENLADAHIHLPDHAPSTVEHLN